MDLEGLVKSPEVLVSQEEICFSDLAKKYRILFTPGGTLVEVVIGHAYLRHPWLEFLFDLVEGI